MKDALYLAGGYLAANRLTGIVLQVSMTQILFLCGFSSNDFGDSAIRMLLNS